MDLYFRQFSGHTQVNAADLRMMHYPNLDTLARLGNKVDGAFPSQEDVDRLLDAEIDTMTLALVRTFGDRGWEKRRR